MRDLVRMKAFRDILPILTLFFAGLKYVFRLSAAMDIGLYDESVYLYNGANILTYGLPGAEGAPLYAIYYFLLSLLQPDYIQLYYLNYKVLTISTPIVLYILLRRNHIGPMQSLVFSSFFLLSSANIVVWPKPGHFALLIVMLSLIASSYFKSPIWHAVIAGLGALLASYVRPEYFLSFLLFMLVCLISSLARYKKNVKELLAPLLFIIPVTSILLILFGQPAFRQSAGRSFFAFGQHFSLNWVLWGNSTLDPWTNWQKIISDCFGVSQSISEALMNNPFLFAQHVVSNILAAPHALLSNLKLHCNIIMPHGTGTALSSVLFLFFIVIILYQFHKVSFSDVYSYISKNSKMFLYLFIYAFPGIVSAIIIFPRLHYLLMINIIMVIFVVVVMQGFERKFLSIRAYILAGVVIIGLTPCLYNFYGNSAVLENRGIISFIRSLGIDSHVTLLEMDGGYSIYLGDRFAWVEAYKKNGPFSEFVQKEHQAWRSRKTAPPINMIIASGRLKNHPQYANDPEWIDFLNDFDSYGFRKINIPNSSRDLFVKSKIIGKHPP